MLLLSCNNVEARLVSRGNAQPWSATTSVAASRVWHGNRRRHRSRRCSSSSRPRHLHASNSDRIHSQEEPEGDMDGSRHVTHRRGALFAAAVAGGCAMLSVAREVSATTPPRSSPSSSSLESIRSAYDSYSRDYDSLDGGPLAQLLGFSELRRRAVGAARGRVLELGVGTGLNLPLYYSTSPSSPSSPSSSSVASLTAVDLSPGMLSVAARRVEELGLGEGSGRHSPPSPSSLPPPMLVAADAASLPFEDASFDTVLDTFSLCVFPDPLGALSEARRVLEPTGGRAVLVEHCRSEDEALGLLGAYQDATAGLIARGGGGGKGCVWNQDVRGLLEEAGFVVEREERAAAGTVGLFVARVKAR